MAEKQLLIDQGNTRIKWICAEGDRFPEPDAIQGDFAAFRRYCEHTAPPGRVLLANVAGADRERAITEVCASTWGLETRVLRSTAMQAGVHNAYESPGMLGVDRWLAIVGAATHHGMPVIVWDLGTATTLDAVDHQGRHLGGLILPGPATMLDSLGTNTRLDVPASLRDNGGGAPGRATAQCIASGVLSAQLGAFERFSRSVGGHFHSEPRIVIAGGAAAMLNGHLPAGHVHDPLLVFRGMLTA